MERAVVGHPALAGPTSRCQLWDKGMGENEWAREREERPTPSRSLLWDADEDRLPGAQVTFHAFHGPHAPNASQASHAPHAPTHPTHPTPPTRPRPSLPPAGAGGGSGGGVNIVLYCSTTLLYYTVLPHYHTRLFFKVLAVTALPSTARPRAPPWPRHFPRPRRSCGDPPTRAARGQPPTQSPVGRFLSQSRAGRWTCESCGDFSLRSTRHFPPPAQVSRCTILYYTIILLYCCTYYIRRTYCNTAVLLYCCTARGAGYGLAFQPGLERWAGWGMVGSRSHLLVRVHLPRSRLE